MARKRYIQAINEALFEEMERDENVILIGEDVELAIFGDARGLYERFGRNRIRNTPICEATLTGMALGATAAGYHVILHMMFANFVYTGFDAIANQISKMRLMTGGQIEIPITFIAGYGGGGSNAAQHSDSAHPALMNLGGINVAMPSNSADAKGLLKTAIRSRNPCFFLEASARGGQMGEVPDGEHLVPFGKAAIARAGTDVTIVTVGSTVRTCLDAAQLLADSGISPEQALGMDFRTGRGCGQCRGTGFKGRKAVAEVLILDDELREMIVTREPVRRIKEAAYRKGTRLLREVGLDLVRRGETTLQELNRVVA